MLYSLFSQCCRMFVSRHPVAATGMSSIMAHAFPIGVHFITLIAYFAMAFCDMASILEAFPYVCLCAHTACVDVVAHGISVSNLPFVMGDFEALAVAALACTVLVLSVWA